MVVWQGLGFLTPLCMVAAGAICAVVMGDASRASGLPLFCATVLAAVLNWAVGTMLQRHDTRQGLEGGTLHTFCGLPVRWWSVLYPIFGAGYLIYGKVSG